MPQEQRISPRIRVACPLTLMRRRGRAISGRTEDVGQGGARVLVNRPLGVDEELSFDLALGDDHVDGRARVLRQQGLNCYALRFEFLDPAAANRLMVIVSRIAGTSGMESVRD